MRWALLTCASLSIAAHALTVTLLPSVERPARTQRKPAGSPQAWQMRLTSLAAGPSLSASTPTVEQAAREASPIETAPIGVTATTDTAAPSTELPPSPQAVAPLAATSPGETGGNSEYIPRPQLSVPPVPQAPVIMTPPAGSYPLERITGILSLYIDETGKVHHIAASGTPMPPEFEEAARQAFMALTFRPGILDGTPVKSRIRIEVVFDNTPLTETAPQSTFGADSH